MKTESDGVVAEEIVRDFMMKFVKVRLYRMAACGNSSNLKPIRTDWIVDRPGWVPTLENLLSAAALFGETAYSL